jgi:cell division topological specificity factor
VFEFLRRLFAPEPRSSDMAKERLRLVLLSDHLSLAPDVVEALKRDLLAVISQYLEIDPAHADVTFEQGEREVAMLASIPITGVRDRLVPPPRAVAPPPAPVASEPLESEPEPVAAADSAAVDGEPHPEPTAEHSEAPVQTFQARSDEAPAERPALSRRQRRQQQRPSSGFGSA